MVLACSSVLAQNRTITGKISDETGKMLEGASVQARGSKTAVVTKADGSFSIQIGQFFYSDRPEYESTCCILCRI